MKMFEGRPALVGVGLLSAIALVGQGSCSSSTRNFGDGESAGSGGEGAGSGGIPGSGGSHMASGGTKGGNMTSAAGEGGAAGSPFAAGANDCGAGMSSCAIGCVNTDADAKNCGRCGHDCLGGECALGVCQPIQIAKGQGRIMVVLVDGQFIYWGGDGAIIAKKSLDSTGDATVFAPASASERAYAAVVTDRNLFWVNDFQDKGIRGCSLPNCDGGPSLLIPTDFWPGSLTFNQSLNTLFWAQESAVWSQALSSGTAAQLVPTTHEPLDLTSDALFLYWVEYDATNKQTDLRKVPVSGGQSSSLATSISDLGSLAPFGKTLFVLSSPAQGPAQIFAVPLPNGIGSAAASAFVPAGYSARVIAVDDSGIYWTQRENNVTDGSIRHCPLTGCKGDTEILALSGTPWALTTDANAIYWGTEDGFVMKLAK